ncbi:MAG: hypothetical protein AB4062_15390 [Crocosphaera sp.]
MSNEGKKVTGIIVKGHRVASGKATNSPYPRGTIEMQTPHFKRLGLDISAFFAGTLNINIRPYKFKVNRTQYTFKNLQWNDNSPPETFSFSPCQLLYEDREYSSLVYYPHPETKPDHFQDESTLEILAPAVKSIEYGRTIQLILNPQEIDIFLN